MQPLQSAVRRWWTSCSAKGPGAVKKAEQNNKEPAFEHVNYVLSSRQDVLLH